MKLERDGLSREERIWVGHFFSYFGSEWSERMTFCEMLERAGFGADGEIGSDEELTGDGYWHHWAYTRIEATAEACERLDSLARTISAGHGVRYDEWWVVRWDDGSLRDMSGHWTPIPSQQVSATRRGVWEAQPASQHNRHDRQVTRLRIESNRHATRGLVYKLSADGDFVATHPNLAQAMWQARSDFGVETAEWRNITA